MATASRVPKRRSYHDAFPGRAAVSQHEIAKRPKLLASNRPVNHRNTNSLMNGLIHSLSSSSRAGSKVPKVAIRTIKGPIISAPASALSPSSSTSAPSAQPLRLRSSRSTDFGLDAHTIPNTHPPPTTLRQEHLPASPPPPLQSSVNSLSAARFSQPHVYPIKTTTPASDSNSAWTDSALMQSNFPLPTITTALAIMQPPDPLSDGTINGTVGLSRVSCSPSMLFSPSKAPGHRGTGVNIAEFNRNRSHHRHDVSGQLNPATIKRQVEVVNQSRIDSALMMDTMRNSGPSNRVGGGLEAEQVRLRDNDNEMDLHDGDRTFALNKVCIRHSKASNYTRDARRVSAMPMPLWLSQLATKDPNKQRRRYHATSNRRSHLLARTQAASNYSRIGNFNSSSDRQQLQIKSKGMDRASKFNYDSSMTQPAVVAQDEEGVFAYAPPPIDVDSEQVQAYADSIGREYVTSTPPFTFSRSPLMEMIDNGPTTQSHASTSLTESSLFTTVIAPIVIPDHPASQSPFTTHSESYRSITPAGSSSSPDAALHAFLDKTSLEMDQNSAPIDPFGATWVALKKETNTNSGLPKPAQRRFFFQQSHFKSDQPLTDYNDAPSSNWKWVPSFPAAKTPNHRNAPAPPKSQLRNCFLGSHDPLVTSAAIEEASKCAEEALPHGLVVVAEDDSDRRDFSSDFVNIAKGDTCSLGQDDVSNHVRFCIPVPSSSYSWSASSGLGDAISFDAFANKWEDICMDRVEDIQNENPIDSKVGLHQNSFSVTNHGDTIYSKTLDTSIREDMSQNDHAVSTQEPIEEFEIDDDEVSGMQRQTHEEDMQSNASHDSIHSWSEIDGDAVRP